MKQRPAPVQIDVPADAIEDVEGEDAIIAAERQHVFEQKRIKGIRDTGDGMTESDLYDRGIKVNGGPEGKWVLIQQTKPEPSDWGTVSAEEVQTYRELFLFVVHHLDNGSKALFKCTLYGRSHQCLRIVYVRLEADPERRRLGLIKPPATTAGASALGALPQAGAGSSDLVARLLLEKLTERDNVIADLIARLGSGAPTLGALPAPAPVAPAGPILPVVSAFKQAADNLKEAAATITTARDVLASTMPAPVAPAPVEVDDDGPPALVDDTVRIELPMFGEVAVSPRTVEWGVKQWQAIQRGNNDALRERVELTERAAAAEATLARLGRARPMPPPVQGAPGPEPPRPVASDPSDPGPSNGAGASLLGATRGPAPRTTDPTLDSD